ncbi:MAG: serine--tRNA ligase, partial [Chloroflexi bacterium]|nr:serine--tRNA ligase [Chloroflexota bacterium]
MLDLNLIRTQPDVVLASMARRGLDAPIDEVLSLDARRRALLTEAEQLKAARNAVSKEIGKIKDAAEKQAKIAEQKGVGDKIAALDERLRQVDGEMFALLSALPNLLGARVPDGKDDSENVVLRTVGPVSTLPFEPKPHWELGTALGIINFEEGVKLTGSRFYVLH